MDLMNMNLGQRRRVDDDPIVIVALSEGVRSLGMGKGGGGLGILSMRTPILKAIYLTIEENATKRSSRFVAIVRCSFHNIVFLQCIPREPFPSTPTSSAGSSTMTRLFDVHLRFHSLLLYSRTVFFVSNHSTPGASRDG